MRATIRASLAYLDGGRSEEPHALVEEEDSGSGSGGKQAREQGLLEAFIDSTVLNMAMGVVIVVSVAVVAAEVDTFGPRLARDVLENFVTAVFVIEWSLRLWCFGLRWLKDLLHILDTIVVWVPGVLVCWVLDPVLAQSDSKNGASYVKTALILRMLRLFRLVEVLKQLPLFSEMWLLIRGLVGSANTLASALLLIVFNLYIFSIFAVDLIANANFDNATDVELAAQAKFQGLGQAMITLTRFMNGDDALGIIDALNSRLWYAWLFLWLFTAISTFCLLNLVTALIVQKALELTKGDDEELAKEKKKEAEREMAEFERMFMELDDDGSGTVSKEEFKDAFEVPEIRNKLMLLGLKERELMELFHLLDTDGEGQLELDEFIHGMTQMRGVAKNKDMMILIKGIERIEYHVTRIHQELSTRKDPAGSNKEMILSRLSQLRSTMDVRLKKSEVEMRSLHSNLSKILKEAEGLRAAMTGGTSHPSKELGVEALELPSPEPVRSSRASRSVREESGRPQEQPKERDRSDRDKPRRTRERGDREKASRRAPSATTFGSQAEMERHPL